MTNETDRGLYERGPTLYRESMSIPADDADVPDLVWHYTDAAGLLGIIQSGTLRASHVDFMNDTKESHVFDEPLRRYLAGHTGQVQRDLANVLDSWLRVNPASPSGVPRGNYFLTCASADGDSLTMWRNYARERISYALGFDAKEPLVGKCGHSAKDLYWQRVNYVADAETLPRVIRRSIDNLTPESLRISVIEDDFFVNTYEELRTIWKNNSFRDEKEYRMTYIADDTPYWKHRVGAFGLTPYIDVVPKGIGALLPLREVVLSPQASVADVRALGSFLEAHGYISHDSPQDNVTIRPSTIPARW